MLTLFAIPKPFYGHINIIQRNAITSWTLLRPRPEIILLGKEEGTAEIARELNLLHVPHIACNEYGTPQVNSIFAIAQKVGKSSRFAYVNTDIILLEDFIRAIEQVSFPQFMLSGQRWNLDINNPIDFTVADWQEQLLARVKEEGKLEGPQAMDYFVFPRGLYQDIPPFAIGRFSWDNWLLYQALNLNIPLIDGTTAITAVHQNHGYKHGLQGEELRMSVEAKTNEQLLGGRPYAYFMLDLANWLMTPEGLRKPKLTFKAMSRKIDMLPLLHPNWKIAKVTSDYKKILVNLLKRLLRKPIA